MISWLITTILLSWLGVAVYYLLVRRYASAWQRKWFLYAIITASLILPAIVSPVQDRPVDLPEEHGVVAFGQQTHGADMHLKHFCKCTNPNVSHRIRYRTHHWYNVLLDHKHWISGAIIIALLLVILRLLIQYRYLFTLKKSANIIKRNLPEGEVYILYPEKKIGVGAFQLLRERYVIWQPEMDELGENELHGILSHEYSHLIQYNTLERTGLRLLQCLWLLNPVFYILKNELDLISELIADQAGSTAMQSKKAYAHLLLNLKLRQGSQLVSAFKAGGKLGVRIRFLLKSSKNRHWLLPLLAVVLVVGADLITAPRLSAQVDMTLHDLATYEEIYREHPTEEELIYCQDCETVCTPEDE